MQLRQTAGLAVPLVLASLLLAACSSSSSSPSSGSTAATSGTSSSPAAAAAGLKTGMKVFVIPKNLGNNYFTTADSAKTDGAIAALEALGETGTETSGTAATPASQIPAIQAAISKGDLYVPYEGCKDSRSEDLRSALGAGLLCGEGPGGAAGGIPGQARAGLAGHAGRAA